MRSGVVLPTKQNYVCKDSLCCYWFKAEVHFLTFNTVMMFPVSQSLERHLSGGQGMTLLQGVSSQIITVIAIIRNTAYAHLNISFSLQVFTASRPSCDNSAYCRKSFLKILK